MDEGKAHRRSVFGDSITLHCSYSAKSPGRRVASKHGNDFYGSEVTELQCYVKFDCTERHQKRKRFLQFRLEKNKIQDIKLSSHYHFYLNPQYGLTENPKHTIC